MSFYDFGPNDIIRTSIVTNPRFNVGYSNFLLTGSVYLERPYLNQALAERLMFGFSERLGGLTETFQGITASISILPASQGGTNEQLFSSIQSLYSYYSIYNYRYTAPGNEDYVVINVPQIYYDRCIQSGSFSGSDFEPYTNAPRHFYDDGYGGLYSGSVTGSLIGNIFYNEGLVVLTDPNWQTFGELPNTGSANWQFSFSGQHTIPVNVYKTRAPAGQLNASTNKSFYYTPASGVFKGTRQVLTSSLVPYITTVGLYNEQYELVGTARLAQPIRKEFGWDVGINLKLDF